MCVRQKPPDNMLMISDFDSREPAQSSQRFVLESLLLYIMRTRLFLTFARFEGCQL